MEFRRVLFRSSGPRNIEPCHRHDLWHRDARGSADEPLCGRVVRGCRPVPHPVPRRAPPSGACKRRLCLFRPRHGQRTVAADRRNRGGSGNLRGLPFTLDGADRQRPRERWSALAAEARSEEHTSELQSLMRISYAVFCLKKKIQQNKHMNTHTPQNHTTTKQITKIQSRSPQEQQSENKQK